MGCGASAPAPVSVGAVPVVERSPTDGGEPELLNVEAELNRRLDEGLLSPEQQHAVREKLGVAADGAADEPAAATGEQAGEPAEEDNVPGAPAVVPPAPAVPSTDRPATIPGAKLNPEIGGACLAERKGGRLEAAHLAYVLAATGGKGTAREGSPSVVEVYQALKGVYGRSTPQGPGAPPRRDDRADGSRLWMTEAQVEESTVVEDYSTWNKEAERARRLQKLAEIRELTWDLLREASEHPGLKARFMMAEPRPEPEPEPELEPEPEPEPDAIASRELDADELGVSAEFLAQLREVFARVDQNQDGSLTRVELIKRLRKDEELVSLLNLPKHVGDGDRGAFEAVFQGMDTNDDRSVDMHEFVTFFARRHVEGGWLKREAEPGSEVLQLTNDANSSTSAQDSPAKGGKGGQKKAKGQKKKKKK